MRPWPLYFGTNHIEMLYKYKRQGKDALTSFSLNCARNRKPLMVEIECLLL